MTCKWEKLQKDVEESMKNELRKMAENNKCPTMRDFLNESKYNYGNIRNNFQGYENFVKQSGLEDYNKNKFNNINYEADGWVYVVTFEMKEFGEIYYVGKSVNIRSRLNDHCNCISNITLPKRNDNGDIIMSVQNAGEYDFGEIIKIDNYYQKANENRKNFQKRLRYQERMKWHEIAIEKETTKVFGGR